METLLFGYGITVIISLLLEIRLVNKGQDRAIKRAMDFLDEHPELDCPASRKQMVALTKEQFERGIFTIVFQCFLWPIFSARMFYKATQILSLK